MNVFERVVFAALGRITCRALSMSHGRLPGTLHAGSAVKSVNRSISIRELAFDSPQLF
jgi:hypothetical protein